MPICTTTLYHFDRVTDPELFKIISGVSNIPLVLLIHFPLDY